MNVLRGPAPIELCQSGQLALSVDGSVNSPCALSPISLTNDTLRPDCSMWQCFEALPWAYQIPLISGSVPALAAVKKLQTKIANAPIAIVDPRIGLIS